MNAKEIAKVLDEHTRGGGGCCACGWQHVGQSMGGVAVDCRTQHRAHVAEQIAPLIADARLTAAAMANTDAIAAYAELVERVEALASECASSGCIHLNTLWGRLRALIDPEATP